MFLFFIGKPRMAGLFREMVKRKGVKKWYYIATYIILFVCVCIIIYAIYLLYLPIFFSLCE